MLRLSHIAVNAALTFLSVFTHTDMRIADHTVHLAWGKHIIFNLIRHFHRQIPPLHDHDIITYMTAFWHYLKIFAVEIENMDFIPFQIPVVAFYRINIIFGR